MEKRIDKYVVRGVSFVFTRRSTLVYLLESLAMRL